MNEDTQKIGIVFLPSERQTQNKEIFNIYQYKDRHKGKKERKRKKDARALAIG